MSPLDLFPKYRWGYLITALGGCVIIMTLLWSKGFSDFMVIPMAGAWIFGCAAAFNSAAKKKIMSVNEMLDNCRPDEYLANYLPIIPKTHKRMGTVIRLNVSAGYLEGGDLEGARRVLSEIDPNRFPKKLSGLTEAATYHNNWATLFMESGRLDRAKEALNNLKDILNNPAMREPLRSAYDKYYQRNAAKLDLYSGIYTGAYERWKAFLEQETKLRGKVMCRYWLAHVCMHDGLREEAVNHLRFVAGNGGETVYAKDARRALYNNMLDGKALHGVEEPVTAEAEGEGK